MATTDQKVVPETAVTARRPVGLAGSVLANWAWYVVVVFSGFVVPRLVDEYQGQQVLGLWDFGWSLVVYVSFLAFGITSAVNRYVARYRVSADWRSLNETVNSSLVLLSIAGFMGLVAAGGLALAVPWMLPDSSPVHLRAAQWCVLLLAGNAAIQLPGGVFNGVITGFERFDLLNVIRIGRDLMVLLGIAGALVMGLGIVAMAWIVLVSQALGEVIKYLVARHLCDELRLSFRLCSVAVGRDLLVFGGKTVVQSAARAGIYQGVSLLVAIICGPASLAVFARQRALVLHLLRFVKQYAQVLVPHSSVLQAQGRHDRLCDLLVQSTRYGLYVALPFIVLFLVMGGPLLNLWMGPDYEAPVVLAVMAIGHAVYVPQIGAYSVLMGMGRHGLPAVLELAAMITGVGLGLLLLGVFDGGLIAAAVAMTLPLTLAGGVVLPLYACHLLGLRPTTYLARAFPGPILAALPLAACLGVARLLLAGQSVVSLAAGMIPGLLVTLIIYAAWVVPETLRSRIPGLVRRRRPEGHAISPVSAGVDVLEGTSPE